MEQTLVYPGLTLVSNRPAPPLGPGWQSLTSITVSHNREPHTDKIPDLILSRPTQPRRSSKPAEPDAPVTTLNTHVDRIVSIHSTMVKRSPRSNSASRRSPEVGEHAVFPRCLIPVQTSAWTARPIRKTCIGLLQAHLPLTPCDKDMPKEVKSLSNLSPHIARPVCQT